MAETTGGKLIIKVHPNASLFPPVTIKSAVRTGHVEVGEVLISLHENEAPLFGIDVIPFLATSFDEARKLWLASKPEIERKFATQGLMTLFAVPWPPQGIYSNKEINDVVDMKGLSWRVYNDSTQRLADLVGGYPVIVQAADLKQALATGLINALFTSGATGYDVKAWENMRYFYDTQAWLPKNVTFVNKAAFERLDKPTQDAVIKVAAAAEARGWWWSQDKTKWYVEQLAANGMKVLLPSQNLKAGLKQIGEHITEEWAARSGVEGQDVIKAYRR